MIIWSIKLINNVRKAIAGRQHPYQLAWAVAFGALLGILPHGNLVALLVLIFILSIRVNHAMAAIVAIGVSFAAVQLDTSSHQVGHYVLTEPSLTPHLSALWGMPLVPWTHLNNTVVMGSLLIGIAALVPIFVVSYPVFRFLARRAAKRADALEALETSLDSVPKSKSQVKSLPEKTVIVDPAHSQLAPPHSAPQRTLGSPRRGDSQPVTGITGASLKPHVKAGSATVPKTAVETRIDVIRVKQHVPTSPEPTPKPVVPHDLTSASKSDAGSTDHQPMDEALSYLLRQLRTSQQKDAA